MEIFGDIERLVADLYPYRWPIAAGLLVVLAAVAVFGYHRGWHQRIWRHQRVVGIVSVPMLAAIIVPGWFLASPLFTNVTVEEELPFAFRATVPTGMTQAEVEQIMAGMAKVNQEVNEAMPVTMAIMNSNGVTMNAQTSAASSPEQTSNSESAQTAQTIPVEPMRLKTGNFQDADSFHKGSGQATILRGPDGSHLLRLENLDVTNGPDLRVILTPHPNPTSQSDVKTPGYVELGKLKGNRGNQNYPIPEGVDISAVGSIVIYCKPFHVIFSVASLQGTS